MHTSTHEIRLVKHSKRNLSPKAVRNNTTAIMVGVNSPSLAKNGWTLVEADPSFTTGPGETDDSNIVTSRLHLLASYEREDKAPGKSDLSALVAKLQRKANTPINGLWSVESVDGESYSFSDNGEAFSDNVNNVAYIDVEIPDDALDCFQGLYGLEFQRDIVMARLNAGINSQWVHRFHTVFVGPPGCGKSALAAAFKDMFGEDAVAQYDCTALTSAGLIKDLTDREILPRVAIFEEAEKVSNKDVLAIMLAIMDQRGEINKTTAKTNIQKDAKLYCIATVNNYALFSKLQAGALASRFGRPVCFNRPSREMRALILDREIQKVDGDVRWIEPTIAYCEQHEINDTRAMIDICLSGGDRLLDGTYQAMLEATSIDSVEKTADWLAMEEQEITLDSLNGEEK